MTAPGPVLWEALQSWAEQPWQVRGCYRQPCIQPLASPPPISLLPQAPLPLAAAASSHPGCMGSGQGRAPTPCWGACMCIFPAHTAPPCVFYVHRHMHVVPASFFPAHVHAHTHFTCLCFPCKCTHAAPTCVLTLCTHVHALHLHIFFPAHMHARCTCWCVTHTHTLYFSLPKHVKERDFFFHCHKKQGTEII